MIVSNSPAILVPIDGAPVLKPVPGNSALPARDQHARADPAGRLRRQLLHPRLRRLADAGAIAAGPWTQAFSRPFGMDDADDRAALAKSGTVDLLDGGPKANPKPSLANGVPTIYTSQVPTELIVFKGQPDFVPIVGTQLLWASNTTSDVLIDTTNNNYYVLLAGRWFTSAAHERAVDVRRRATRCRPTSRSIPAQSLAGAVLPTVAGTPQAQEAVIENSIPQTATVPLKNGPKFTPNFDGAAAVRADPRHVAVVRHQFVRADHPGRARTRITRSRPACGSRRRRSTGPVDRSRRRCRRSIYTIPPSSPIYYVTYVRIYEATPTVRLRRLHAGLSRHRRRAVRHRRLRHRLRVLRRGSAASGIAPPYTYGVAAAPIYNPYVGFTYGFALGLATAAWTEPYWGGAYYHPGYWGGYPCCGVGERQRLRPLGQHDVFGHAQLVRGRRRRRHHGERQLLQHRAPARRASYNAGRQYNA